MSAQWHSRPGRQAPDGSGSRARVAVASVGDPESPATWSGTSAGILGGLRELGVATSAVDLEFPRGVEQAVLAAAALPTRNRFDAHGAALSIAARGLLARRRLSPSDGVIQIGTTFALPRDTRYVTLEDMTLRQACTIHPVFSRMSAPGVRAWEQRRADIYAGARMCAVSSHWAADSLVEDYGVPRDRIAVVGLGSNHDVQPGERARERRPRFLFVGIDWERKGGPVLLRAFARVRRTHPDAVLDLVGGHPPVEQEGVTAHGVLSLERAADRRLMGELFAGASCLVVPSRVEPFGIVYLEAASAGVPSIVGSEGGAREAIGDDGGIVVAPGDETELMRAMLRMADPEAARRMGDAVRERSALYTWPKVAERLLRALGLPAPDRRSLAEFL
jgi:glycosyltransferase involved in cell wall biosynthesis